MNAPDIQRIRDAIPDALLASARPHLTRVPPLDEQDIFTVFQVRTILLTLGIERCNVLHQDQPVEEFQVLDATLEWRNWERELGL